MSHKVRQKYTTPDQIQTALSPIINLVNSHVFRQILLTAVDNASSVLIIQRFNAPEVRITIASVEIG